MSLTANGVGVEWIVHSWRIINHVLNCQFSCLSELRLRRSGGFCQKSDQKMDFFKFWISSVLSNDFPLTRVLCMPLRQSIQVLIWSWKARWHLHLHCDCDAAKMGTLHAPPCPLTCLTGGGGIIQGWRGASPLAQTITSLKVVSRVEFRGKARPNLGIFEFV